MGEGERDGQWSGGEARREKGEVLTLIQPPPPSSDKGIEPALRFLSAWVNAEFSFS